MRLLLTILWMLPASLAFVSPSTSTRNGARLFSYQQNEPQYYDDDDESCEQQQQQQQQYYEDQPQEQQYYEQDPQQGYYEEQPPPHQEEHQGLYLGDDVEDQMKTLQSKFPTSEADYLAAARKRAQEARASINNEATDQDWQEMATSTGGDDWESSMAEAGNAESQILIPKSMPFDDGEEEEPTLLL